MQVEDGGNQATRDAALVLHDGLKAGALEVVAYALSNIGVVFDD